jgi:hypothetical protein
MTVPPQGVSSCDLEEVWNLPPGRYRSVFGPCFKLKLQGKDPVTIELRGLVRDIFREMRFSRPHLKDKITCDIHVELPDVKTHIPRKFNYAMDWSCRLLVTDAFSAGRIVWEMVDIIMRHEALEGVIADGACAGSQDPH